MYEFSYITEYVLRKRAEKRILYYHHVAYIIVYPHPKGGHKFLLLGQLNDEERQKEQAPIIQASF